MYIDMTLYADGNVQYSKGLPNLVAAGLQIPQVALPFASVVKPS
jgi:hypothetical protein